METTIKWHGHSAFEIAIGRQNILLDPWLNANPKSDVKAADLKQVDLIAVSHGHSDHFGDTMEIMRGTNAKLICTTMISWYMELRGFTMDCETTIMALDLLKPKILIPMHYNTHGAILVDTDKFVEDVKIQHPEVEVLVMQPGEVFVLEK
jgi:L-ascorbate metabolism protein UlaG (beta-lactamase superfamily)